MAVSDTKGSLSMELQKAFGRRVADLRKAKGYSQESFADACGVHRTYMGSIERGAMNLSFQSQVKIAGTLKITVDGQDWTKYTLDGKHVKFTDVPPFGSKIDVSFKVGADGQLSSVVKLDKPATGRRSHAGRTRHPGGPPPPTRGRAGRRAPQR